MAGQGTENPPLEQAEFDVDDIRSEVARATVRQLLKELNGVRDVQFFAGEAVVTYNPLDVSKDEICQEIRLSGYRATEIESRIENRESLAPR